MTIAQGELILASDMPCVVRATFNGVNANFYYDNTTTYYEIPYSILTFQSGSINLLTQCNQIFVVNLCFNIDRFSMLNYIDTFSYMFQDCDAHYASPRTLFLNNSISINFSTTNITINIIEPSQLSPHLSPWYAAVLDPDDVPYLLLGYKI